MFQRAHDHEVSVFDRKDIQFPLIKQVHYHDNSDVMIILIDSLFF